MRFLSTVFATLAITTGVAFAQTAAHQAPAVAPNAAMHADQFSTEGDAKAHCGSTTVVWMNLSSHVYHFAGARDYGHTKKGAYMCRADADRTGRAAKNEKPPAQ